MTHALLIRKAVEWLRSYRCGVVLSEQACLSGEMPDAIGWKRASHSVLIECKVSRGDFVADRAKPWRQNPETAGGMRRFYLAPRGLIRPRIALRAGDCWSSTTGAYKCSALRARTCAATKAFDAR